MPILISRGRFFGQLAILACDGNCAKAWGINGRPRVQLSDDEDDYESLADGELGDAPVNPGTSEGGELKPRILRHNKWCWRECERAQMTDPGEAAQVELRIELPDWSRRIRNIKG